MLVLSKDAMDGRSYGRMDGPTVGRTDSRTARKVGRMVGWLDGRTVGRSDVWLDGCSDGDVIAVLGIEIGDGVVAC